MFVLEGRGPCPHNRGSVEIRQETHLGGTPFSTSTIESHVIGQIYSRPSATPGGLPQMFPPNARNIQV